MASVPVVSRTRSRMIVDDRRRRADRCRRLAQRMMPRWEGRDACAAQLRTTLGVRECSPKSGVRENRDFRVKYTRGDGNRLQVVVLLDPGDGAGETPRRPDRDDIFRDQRHLLAEAAANLRRDDAEFGFRRLRKLNRAAISESYQGLGMI